MIKLKLAYITLLFPWVLLSAQPDTDSIFAAYFAQAQTFADKYPREKSHLHFDNTSYYVGDTIWFKAYVTTDKQNMPSQLSKPLYVELVDQLGNVSERQIIELQNGEGNGQFVLTTALFSGYYEIRAYTKWMLAFDEKQYFSRTFPIYRKRRSEMDSARSIITYKMDESMKQRPLQKEKKFMLRFYPESGQLVQGIPSLVAFEATSRDNGPADIQGTLRGEENGEVLTEFGSLHEGMGAFVYTPSSKPAIAEVMYEGKKYSFPLPDALSLGYVINTVDKEKIIDVQISRNATTLNDTLALLISHQGRPLSYQVIDFAGKLTHHFTIPTQEYPAGVIQLSLISSKGSTLCDRFCYIMPSEALQLQASSSSALFKPYEPVQYKVSMKDKQGNPVRGHFSVAIRDALNSDYSKYDNTIYTDLLLTSDLKGYIHQPGYYFADNSLSRKAALNMLLLVHGWRKYDMSTVIGDTILKPIYNPEPNLVLHGQVKSFFLGRNQSNMGINILAQRDTLSAAGSTTTDSLGYFHIPMDSFEGTMEALIQTRREGKELNRKTTVMLDRNFEPNLRMLEHEELHPVLEDVSGMKWWARLTDSLYLDSIMGQSKYVLDQVVVKAKRTKSKRILAFEQTVRAYYNIPQELDRLRDAGVFVNYFPDLIAKLNSKINVNGANDFAIIKYNGKFLPFAVNGNFFSEFERSLFIDKDVDCIKTVMINEGPILDAMAGVDLEETGTLFDKEVREKGLRQSRTTPFEESALPDYFLKDKLPVTKSSTEGTSAICYITTVDNWEPEKKYRARGIRQTRIQGYNKPLEFYSPCYSKEDGRESDFRRTLYWNPEVETDENGEAVINCYNASSSTFLTISIEALHDGMPAALNTHSVKYE